MSNPFQQKLRPPQSGLSKRSARPIRPKTGIMKPKNPLNQPVGATTLPPRPFKHKQSYDEGFDNFASGFQAQTNTPNPPYVNNPYQQSIPQPQQPNNDFGLNFDNLGSNPLLQVGLQQTQQYMGQTMNKFSPGVSSFWDSMKFHFTVNNHYVLNKIKFLLFPFLYKFDTHISKTGNETKAPPIVDIYCIDLYLPSMSFITYTLLVGLLDGKFDTTNKFSPQLLGDTISVSLSLQFLQIGYVLGANALLSVRDFDYTRLELLGLTGYKYVGICLALLIGLVLFKELKWVYLFALAYLAVTSVFFSMKILNGKMGKNERGALPKRCKALILGHIMLESLIIGYLGYMPELVFIEVED